MSIFLSKLRNIFLATGAFALLLAGVWYFGFDRNISLPSRDSIKKIEVCQNDFKQRAQLITYIEEEPKIQKIYEFIDQRKKGWEPYLYSPTPPVVTADFYGSDGVLLQLYLMKSTNFLVRTTKGAYLKSLKKDERTQFFDLLGIPTGQVAEAHPKNSLN